MKRKPTTPEGHAGIFQSYSEIPARYRLETYSQYYEGEDTLEDYYEEVYFPARAPVTDSLRKRANRAKGSWIEHMQDRDRHHALAKPQDVNAWCDDVLNSCSTKVSYETYYSRILNFYNYLKSNHRHPHLYNPLLLAAIEYDAAYQVWYYRVKNRPSNNYE